MPDTISLAQFLRFCNQPYGLPVHLQRLQDTRRLRKSLPLRSLWG